MGRHSSTGAYDYVQKFMDQVFNYRSVSEDVIRAKAASKPPTHPEMIQPTTAHTAPPLTSEIFEKKKSRFQLIILKA